MRILVLTFYYQPDLCAGSFRTTAFMKELEKRLSSEDEVDVITTMPNRYHSFHDSALAYEESNSVKINRIDLGTHKSGFVDQSILFCKFAINVVKLIRKREKYDIVYATSSRLMTAFLGALIANKQKSKLFLDLRDIFTDTLESIFEKSKIRHIIPLFKKIEEYAVNSATSINLVSKGFEQYFKNINDKIDYSFYSNGIDDEFLNYDFTKEEDSSKKIITYAGNIGEGQGLEKIIPKIAQKLSLEYEIHIIGDGGRKNNLIQELKGIENVKLFDPVNRAKLLDIYKNSDFLFLHLNDYEAFKKVLPSKIFEYAATNKFILAGVGGYAKEFIEKNISDAIVFEPCNENDFFDKLKHIEQKPNIDRKAFIKEFSRENIMKDLSQKVYEL